MGGALGIGGPPVVAYASLQDWDPKRCKALLCTYFMVANGYRMVLLGASGLFTRDVGVQALTSLPALLGGTYLGVLAFGHIPATTFRKVVLLTPAALALTLLVLGH